VGTNTLTVSLPSRWVKKYELNAGDELAVLEGEKEICFSLGKKKVQEKEITVDISDLCTHTLTRTLETLYITSYNRIILTHSRPIVYSDKKQKDVNIRTMIKKLSNRYIGMEVVSQTKKMTELHCLLLAEQKDIEKIEKRIFFLFKDIMEEFIESLHEKHHEFHENVYEHHDNIGKFIAYYLRVLDQSEKSEEEKKHLFSLYMIIDKMMDKFRHVNEMIHAHGCTPRVKKVLKEIFELIYEHFAALHKKKISRELITQRYGLVRKVEGANYTLPELKVVNEVKIFLDVINDFSRVIIVGGLG